jgi:hypothetical protein
MISTRTGAAVWAPTLTERKSPLRAAAVAVAVVAIFKSWTFMAVRRLVTAGCTP